MEGKQEKKKQWQPRLCFVLKLASFVSFFLLNWTRRVSWGEPRQGERVEKRANKIGEEIPAGVMKVIISFGFLSHCLLIESENEG